MITYLDQTMSAFGDGLFGKKPDGAKGQAWIFNQRNLNVEEEMALIGQPKLFRTLKMNEFPGKKHPYQVYFLKIKSFQVATNVWKFNSSCRWWCQPKSMQPEAILENFSKKQSVWNWQTSTMRTSNWKRSVVRAVSYMMKVNV